MKRIILTLAIFIMGCLPAQPILPDMDIADVRWWDFRACLDDVDTCTDFFFDNETVILGGHNLVIVLDAFLNAEVFRNTSGADDEPLQFEYNAFGLPIILPTSDAPDPTDLSSWDLSSCFDDFESFETCWALLLDNEDLILGGRSFLEIVLGEWKG